MRLRLEKRLESSLVTQIMVPLAAIILSLILCAGFLSLTGRSPIAVYGAMFGGAFGTSYGLAETVVKGIPLMLCGLGVSMAFRMQLWNIGAEGQFYMGAFAATAMPILFPTLPVYVMLPAMIILGLAAGGLWALLPAFLRIRWQVNEIITTLMMNYVGILWVSYLVYGPWKDPKGLNFPLTAQFPDSALLPTFGASRIHWGILFAVGIAAVLWLVFRNSRWGYEIKVIGHSLNAARYCGMDIKKNMYWVMIISGALCGLAGMAEVSGIVGRLQTGISPGYGYTAIIVAWLAKLHPGLILVVAMLFGALQVGGYTVQTMGVPASVASMIQGAILFFVVGGEIFTQYRLVVCKEEEVAGHE